MFARFFLVAALGSCGRMAMPFYILYAGLQIDITGAVLGVLTTAWMLSGTVTMFSGVASLIAEVIAL